MRVLLVVYDNDSYTHLFPMGLGYIAAVLEKDGHDVEVYSQDYHHYPDPHLTRYLDEHSFDVVAVSVIAGYYQYRKLLSISAAINASKQRPVYMLGGYGPTPAPEFFINKTGADIVVMGEGENTAVALMKALENKTPLADVTGIAFKDGSKVTENQRRPLIEDLDSIPWPAYHKFPIEYYRLEKEPRSQATDFGMPMMSARGCTFKCTFCYRMDTGYRARDPINLLDEVEFLHKEYGITYVSFQDDLLMSSVSHTENVCREFKKRNLPVKWNCNGRLNYCSVELVKMMKDSGCVFINYGIESMDDQVLKNMKKGLRTDMIVKGIEMTLEAGISPGLNMMFGNIGDTRETLKKAVDFLVKYDDFAQMRTIRPVTPYPGSPLYFDAIDKGLIKDIEDFYENKHVNSDLLAANFTEMSDDEVYECLTEANTTLLNNYHDMAKKQALDQVTNLYKDRQVGFRGFRQL
ncbi:MAG: B12-binding domain-containing radical SAM protein [Rhodospirillaceae bacterium]|jgi:anaerobic magnesium-protoporphyrin IX monomethyl ester cyclase|nr:B12-binding domain-containing radical SAM protein [Rhodospirillaceae bacterium]MBT5245540.1 B12-binding domain-containing radical SAM protein [Rhodospirillaceae bacterium]MBT5561022.1 B12-binding domain-containing radical SAM protein [Rhodospirillaceae bacterium]MBT6240658.1 B12-binding domain-containing radical SAM protein [Rhodospirillaceae bacterium]